MRKDRLLLLIFFLICASGVITAFENRTQCVKLSDRREVITSMPEERPQYEYKHPPSRWFAYHYNWFLPQVLNIDITYEFTKMELTSLGYYYLTAYAPEECGYNGYNYPTGWMTASGAICHRADWENRLTEPTTCAIDRSLHHFGDLFYIAEFDRIFVAEDTGSAVKGKHIDLFYDYYGMVSFPTGWYETFAVEYVTEEVTFNVWEIRQRERQKDDRYIIGG